MSQLKEISRFNELIGNKKGDAVDNPQNFFTQLQLIKEEYQELERTVQELILPNSQAQPLAKNLRVQKLSSKPEQHKQLLDDLGDIIVTCAGLIHRIGVCPEDLIREINQSNFSKFCTTAEEVNQTQAYYMMVKNVMTHVEGSIPEAAVVSTKDQYTKPNSCGKYIPQGKLLKSVNFYEPNLDKFL